MVLERWDKEYVVAAMQTTIRALPTDTPQDRKVKLEWLREYFKICGYYQAEAATSYTNNILIMTKEESRDVWEQRIQAQQRRLGAKTKMATDTG